MGRRAHPSLRGKRTATVHERGTYIGGIVVENCRNVFTRESVGCVTDQQTGFSDSTIPTKPRQDKKFNHKSNHKNEIWSCTVLVLCARCQNASSASRFFVSVNWACVTCNTRNEFEPNSGVFSFFLLSTALPCFPPSDTLSHPPPVKAVGKENVEHAPHDDAFDILHGSL